MTSFKGMKFKKIIRTKDEKGRILTYKVKHKGFTTEHNTLREAKVMAVIIPPIKKRRRKR
jgi:hypothetical protein